jgi:hypothetical protein
MQKCTVYEGCSASDRVIQNFWAVLSEFSQAERVLYLRFVWGRSRLPLSRSAFERLHKVSYMAKDTSVADRFLPVGHTCFFSIDIPRYSSQRVRCGAFPDFVSSFLLLSSCGWPAAATRCPVKKNTQLPPV